MRTYEEYHQIMSLWESGLYNKKQIARETGIPRGTVQSCIKRFKTIEGLKQYRSDNLDKFGTSSLLADLKNPADPQDIHSAYAYIFGMYLGDGCISKVRRVYRMRISLDKKHPTIIKIVENRLKHLCPKNKIGMVDKDTWWVVSLYRKDLPKLFPQDGDGMKHERRIILEDWQQRIVDNYPLEFLRGLYHSDGSRSINRVYGREYPRYFFSNASDDIRKLFTDTAEKLGLSWTTANHRNVAISRREDVAWLDEHVGDKS